MTGLARTEQLMERATDVLPSVAARQACRNGLDATTAGLANGYVQGNLAILPKNLADDFLRFCQLNPKPCPIIGVSEAGDSRIPALGLDLDIRTDVPRYRVWRDGELVDEPTDVTAWWRDDLVAFVIGCSYSFEQALIEDGLPIRHIERGAERADVPDQHRLQRAGPVRAVRWSSRCGRSSRRTRSGRCRSRRAFPPCTARRSTSACRIRSGSPTSRSPTTAMPCRSSADEFPVFWACGVTPQAVIAAAKPSVRHHACSRPDAGDRSQERATRRALEAAHAAS